MMLFKILKLFLKKYSLFLAFVFLFALSPHFALANFSCKNILENNTSFQSNLIKLNDLLGHSFDEKGTFISPLDVNYLAKHGVIQPEMNSLSKLLAQIYNSLRAFANKVDDALKDRDTEIQVAQNFRYAWTESASPVYDSAVISMIQLSKILNLKPNQSFVDMGSGLGFPVAILSVLNPNSNFTGYEFMSAKVDGAQQLIDSFNIKNAEFIRSDFAATDFDPVVADVYYFYYPSSYEAMQAASEKIVEANRGRTIRVVGYRYLDQSLMAFKRMGYEDSITLEGPEGPFEVLTLQIDAN